MRNCLQAKLELPHVSFWEVRTARRVSTHDGVPE